MILKRRNSLNKMAKPSKPESTREPLLSQSIIHQHHPNSVIISLVLGGSDWLKINLFSRHCFVGKLLPCFWCAVCVCNFGWLTSLHCTRNYGFYSRERDRLFRAVFCYPKRFFDSSIGGQVN